MARVRIRSTPAVPGAEEVTFLSTGCTLLDQALGGGWAERRIVNIVGDKSTGKTLLAMEAAANFVQKYPGEGEVDYEECEAAFDPRYASALGLPMSRINFGKPMETVEDLFENLNKSVQSKVPRLKIVDSLDALSDRAEIGRDMDQGTYGAEKAKKLSQLFRRLVRKMSDSNMTLMIISQVRSNIGVTFGRSTTRSGGRALDFYCSQVLYLQHVETIKRSIGNVKRPVAIECRAKVDKNKVGLPMREVEFVLQFGYGIDDLTSNLEWLKEVGHLDDVGISDKGLKSFIRKVNALPDDEYHAELKRIRRAVKKRWAEIESGFMPARRKYA